jgi:enamine deaminase RidA (YjgF/YER057c/UK114 family)
MKTVTNGTKKEKEVKIKGITITIILTAATIFSGCSMDETRMQEIARIEAEKLFAEYKKSFEPETFNFGVFWEDEFSFSQANKVGNMIFLAGQLPHDTEVDENGNPRNDYQSGKNFEEQLRQTLENMKKVLAHYGATMDDVVFLQHFVDPVAGNNRTGDYNPVLARLISEYFPNGLQGMTCVEVDNLYGPEQLIESNAIAVINR